jgi:exodeoxyribonuclease VII large subunit
VSKPAKSQWDFGELFPTEQFRRVMSVAELTAQVRRLLEQHIGSVWVGGEITNLREQSSGHIYFTLKDAAAQLNCVLFRDEARGARDLLEDGRRVILQGEVTVYEVRGQYQLIVRRVELQGVGALQVAFEKLKQKLQTEGLFAPERKRPLPKFPQRIGLVTSPTGAAIRDVLHVVRRRNPSLEIILAPCHVQGEGAGREIAAAIRLLNEFAVAQASRLTAAEQAGRLCYFDLILVTRGGGSLEDLWAFNEEIVARAIFESVLPVISAVGHEIDFTISDFVADVRAATPSAAAEIITEGVFSSCRFVGDAQDRICQLARRHLDALRYQHEQAMGRLTRLHPRRRFNEHLQRLDDLQGSLARCLKHGARQQRIAWRNLTLRLLRVRPGVLLKQRRELFFQENQRLHEAAKFRMQQARDRVAGATAKLRLLGPEQVLARGYSITTDASTGKVLHEAKNVEPGQRLKTRLKVGEVISRVEQK